MKAVIAFTLLACCGAIQTKDSEQRRPRTLAEAKSRFNQDERNLVDQPFENRRKEIDAEYLMALKASIELARTYNKADDLPHLEAELTRIEQGKRENPLREIPATKTLRNLRIYRDRVVFHEKQKQEERRKLLRNEFMATLTRLEDEFIRNNDDEEARKIAEFRRVASQDWAATRSVDADAVGTRQTNFIPLLPQFAGKSGRLRVIGEFNWEEPVLPPEATSMTDFVEVHAFERGWAAIRKNGNATIYARQGLGAMKLVNTADFHSVGRTRDFWTVRGEKRIWREIEPNKWFPLPAAEPLILVGCHTAGLAYFADGRLATYGSGFGSSRLGPPPADFFSGASGAIGGSTSLMVMTPDGRVRGWDTVKRKHVEFPKISGIVEMEPGIDFAIMRRGDGTLVGAYLDGRPEAGNSTWKIPPEAQGAAKKVRCGGVVSSIQREDGSWFAWGPNRTLCEAINNVGAVMDLDMYVNNADLGYVIYIEVVE